MHLLKKMLAITGSIGIISTTASSVIACTTSNVLRILLIPSNDEARLQKQIPKLQELIENQLFENGFKRKVRITVASSYDAATASVAAGTAAIGYIPTAGYFESSIRHDSKNKWAKKDSMHQLFQTQRNALRVEYKVALDQIINETEISDEQQLKEAAVKRMNDNGSLQDLDQDEANMFNIVKGYANVVDRTEVDTSGSGVDAGISATYYRAHNYIRKDTLKLYLDDAIGKSDSPLKEAWKEMVVDHGENVQAGQAVFNKDVITNQENLKKYWMVVWDILERASNGLGLAIAGSKTSSAGRIMPIEFMTQAYLKSHANDAGVMPSYDEASDAIIKLLKGKYVSLASYNDESINGLLKKSLDVGIGFADSRTQYGMGTDAEVQPALDNITIFGVSHGIINDGATYSTKYFADKLDLLKAIQLTFKQVIESKEGNDLLFNIYHHTGYTLSPVGDSDEDRLAMKEYEQRIAEAMSGDLVNKVKAISEAI